MLRFVFVTTFYPPHHFGGDAVLVRHMAEALVRAGHRVDVVYDVDAYRALDRNGFDPAAPADSNGVRVHALHSALGRLS
ncbi:MAG TPA: glycosyltransferase family 1 protein, partial [Thermoanaerobaculia bacterium]|nr:glycosyltransferase family 1 protein [Thermoanaerobaculia bacterium]